MDDHLTTITQDLDTGELVIDLVQAPGGDLATVSGGARLVQDVIRWLLTPEGALPYDPTYGNPFFSLLGRPQGTDPSQYVELLKQAEYEFLLRQQAAAQAGSLSDDELVDHFEGEVVTLPQAGTVAVSFVVVARSGVRLALPQPVYYQF